MLFQILFTANVFAQLRSFNDIFPNLNQEAYRAVFSDAGFVRTGQAVNNFESIGRNSGINTQIVNAVLARNPSYLVESISVIPVEQGNISLLHVYNALGNIRDLSGREYLSHTRQQYTALFEETTRIVSDRQTTPIPDPAPAISIPRQETAFIRLKDANFGTSFYRWEMSLLPNGLRYNLTNFRHLSVLFVPVIREGNLFAQFYIEPLKEGVLIYSIAGAEISDFFSSRIHMESAIAKRLAVITSWAADCIKSIK